jgi:hypothetical protein
MPEEEVDFICDAVEFVADFGYLFLSDYVVDIETGKWAHKNQKNKCLTAENFGIEESIKYIGGFEKKNDYTEKVNMAVEYKKYLSEAKKYAEQREKSTVELKYLDEDRFKGYGWFYYVNLTED